MCIRFFGNKSDKSRLISQREIENLENYCQSHIFQISAKEDPIEVRTAFSHLYYQMVEIENHGNVVRRKTLKVKENSRPSPSSMAPDEICAESRKVHRSASFTYQTRLNGFNQESYVTHMSIISPSLAPASSKSNLIEKSSTAAKSVFRKYSLNSATPTRNFARNVHNDRDQTRPIATTIREKTGPSAKWSKVLDKLTRKKSGEGGDDPLWINSCRTSLSPTASFTSIESASSRGSSSTKSGFGSTSTGGFGSFRAVVEAARRKHAKQRLA